MMLGKVTGKVISTQKDSGLEGLKMLIVQDARVPNMDTAPSYVVAADSVGAGLGEMVIVVTGSSARFAAGLEDRPVDCAIVGIVDTVNLEGEVVYSKREAVKVG